MKSKWRREGSWQLARQSSYRSVCILCGVFVYQTESIATQTVVFLHFCTTTFQMWLCQVQHYHCIAEFSITTASLYNHVVVPSSALPLHLCTTMWLCRVRHYHCTSVQPCGCAEFGITTAPLYNHVVVPSLALPLHLCTTMWLCRVRHYHCTSVQPCGCAEFGITTAFLYNHISNVVVPSSASWQTYVYYTSVD